MKGRARDSAAAFVRCAVLTALAWTPGAWGAGASDAANAANPGHAADSAAPAQPITPEARLLATARLWAAKHRDDLALQAVQKARLVAPDDAVLLSEEVRIDLRLGKARDAAALLDRLKARQPNAAVTLELEDEYRAVTSGRDELATIRLLARSGQSEAATRRLLVLFPHGAPPGELGAEYYRILSGTPAGYAQAVAALRQRVAGDPTDSAAALALVGLLNEKSATRAEANRLAWSLAKRQEVDHTAAMNAWRSVLQSAGTDPAYRDAIDAYLVFEPNDSEFKDRASTLDAERQAQLTLERNPDYIAEHQGLRALAHGDLPAADTLLTRAAKARASDADAVGGLGLVRLREGRQDEAHALFLRAAALAPDDRAKWDGLARTALVWGMIAKAREAAAAGRAQDAQHDAQAALALDPTNAQAKQQLADAWLAQRDWVAAEPLLRELLANRELNMGAVESMQTLLRESGRENEIPGLLDALAQRFRDQSDRKDLAGLRADVLILQAQRLVATGKIGPAAEDYEKALRLAPDVPWTRFALARIYRDLGLPQLGRAVMDDGLATDASPEMRYAAALYRNSIDDLSGAQTVLAGVAPNARTEGMRSLASRIDAQLALRQARTAFASGDREAAARALDVARTKGGDDPYVTASVGALLIDEGQPDQGLALMRDWMANHPTQTDVDVELRYGDLLGSAERNDALADWLARLRGEPNLTVQQSARLEDQSLRLVLRETDAALEQLDYARARRLLAQASPAGKRDKRYALELADLERAQGHYDAARAALAPVLAKSPEDADARLALARVEEDSGHRADALRIVREVLEAAPPDDVDTRLSAARRLTALRRTQEAEQLTDALQQAYPARSDVTVQAGRVAEELGEYDKAAALYRRSMAQERAAGEVSRSPDGTPGQAALADLEQRRDPEIEAAWMPAFKSGDAGISDYHAQQVPIYVQMPYRYEGHFFLHLDAVHLDAGTLSIANPAPYAQTTFGTYSAFQSGDVPTNTYVLHQHADGVALGTGFTSDAWRFDVGTTPLGFPIHYLVGGVRYRFDAGPASFSVSASRRPETSSELSYAGLRDPWTNALWGGVRRDGIDWHAGIDIGRTSLFSELGAGVLTGVHVASNQEMTLRTGFTTPVYEGQNMRVNTGVVGNYWHYTNNLRFYTYGQGGYYSPQRYLSFGVPIEWTGRRGGFKWDLTATVGASNSYEKNSPYYPDGLPGAPNMLPTQTLAGTQVFTGGSTRGLSFSYGVSGVVEYRFNPRLVAGLSVDIDHAHDYAPSSGMVYVRYSFDARKPDTSLSPRPVSLYSSY
ncbi:cellulose synthase subunit BcsC-related outer membrane protein [Trinickia dinghuensis]|uniref:Cellulose biosynthesis protein n=1 Tax=Trinickia dinghuensis TaxID=2291023 RepID=A0A3D8K2H1_9BURK|nr:cellulose synthase subunit BcsC-related outer membrane protein [Trinickia dinghuensis]RDU99055.1 cellulose biosynthesis protein [Trinickia dinghuensis]